MSSPDSPIQRPDDKPEAAREKAREFSVTFASAAKELASPDRKNEDCVLHEPALGLYAVFDGMGGHKAGAVASGTAAETIAEAVRTKQGELEMRELIRTALQTANQKVIKEGKKPEYRGMGTTAVVIKTAGEFPDGSIKIVVGYCGDSRLYIKRFDRDELEVTLDDNLATDAFINYAQPGEEKTRDNGVNISDEEKIKRRMTAAAVQRLSSNTTDMDDLEGAVSKLTLGDSTADPETLAPIIEACLINRNVVTGGIGVSENFTPHVYYSGIRPGDKWLLASDGVTDNLTEEQIKEMLSRDCPAEEFIVAAQAVTRTESERAKLDDMSAMVGELKK